MSALMVIVLGMLISVKVDVAKIGQQLCDHCKEGNHNHTKRNLIVK